MRLNSEVRAVLGHTPIGMLALRAGRLPLVNPAAFHFAAGSLWMTTSRYAAKIVSAKRDPRAAFLVDSGAQALLLRGALEVYDPLSVSSQVRAVLDAARSVVWSSTPVAVPAGNGVSVPFYARAFALQDVSVGSYTDTLIVTFNF